MAPHQRACALVERELEAHQQRVLDLIHVHRVDQGRAHDLMALRVATQDGLVRHVHVAEHVAVSVVQILEMIGVEHEAAHRQVIAPSFLEDVMDDFEEMMAVVDQGGTLQATPIQFALGADGVWRIESL